MQKFNGRAFTLRGGYIEAVFAQALGGGIQVASVCLDQKNCFAPKDKFGLKAFGFGEVRFRQPNPERGAFTFKGIHRNRASMFFHEELGVIQSKSGTLVQRFGGEEWIKDLLQMFACDAAAGVAHLNAHCGQFRNCSLDVGEGRNLLMK